MKLKIYQVDAFAGNVFKGNPAAILHLHHIGWKSLVKRT